MTATTLFRLLARLGCLACLTTSGAFAQYAYYFSDNFVSSINSANYWQNGWGLSASNGLYDNDPSGGALISKVGLPTGADYEVKATLHLDTSSTGAFIIYLRATSNSMLQGGNPGTYYAVTLNPGYAGGAWSGALGVWKSVSGVVGEQASSTVPCHDGSTMRAVIRGTSIAVWIDNELRLLYGDSSITSGQPGIGAVSTGSSSITNVSFGPLDYVAPNAVSAQSVGSSVYPTHVDLQWKGVTDNTNGIGLAYYDIYRNGAWINHTLTPDFSDPSVSAATPYEYWIVPVDYHLSSVSTRIYVTTPDAHAIDPREVGIRSLGSYWGGGGEQIDMRAGNLSYTTPLLKAQGRGGFGVGFNLSYNSQNWRQDNGGVWQLGRDVGYGYGWRLQAGSLTPVYSAYWTVDHYLFIDSTGAEYRLDQNNGGVWSSKEGIYVYYDSNVSRLYFRDGSFWLFGCQSAGTEQDAGTLYPTQMQDTNGNQFTLHYYAGLGTSWANSSARIQYIQDIRALGSPQPTTYNFTYNTDSIPHLSAITNTIGTSESYQFYYQISALNSPFSPNTSYGNWTYLRILTNNLSLSTSYTYDSTGTGELVQANTPYGGYLLWQYGAATLLGPQTFREVQARAISMSAGATPTWIGFYRDTSGDPSFPVHQYVTMADWSLDAQKVWYFKTSGTYVGQLAAYQERSGTYASTPQFQQEFTWATQASSANPYIATTLTTLDSGTSYAIQKQTTQVVDPYGNLTQVQAYNFGNLSTPARTYTNTFLNSSNYTSRYIYNRLLSSTVYDGTYSATLVSVTYDNYQTSSTCPSTLTFVPASQHDTSYDASFSYRGNPTNSSDLGGVTCTAYDTAGNVTSATRNGVITSVTTGGSTNYAAPTQITTNSLSSTASWTAALGLSSSSGPNGDVSSIIYDSNARPATSTSPFGGVTNYAYNDTSVPPNRVATTNGHWVKTTMDGFGRTVKSETGYGTTTLSVVDSVYAPCACSPLGKLKQQSQPYKPGDPEHWISFTYDVIGRTVTMAAPDGTSTTAYVYKGNTVQVTDPAGNSKTFTLDAFGNLASVKETDPTFAAVTTNYTYDLLNHLTQVSMPRGTNTQTRSFSYRSGVSITGQLQSATNPENGTVYYGYNSDYTIYSKTDAKGQVFTYAYDAYKRVINILLAGSPIRNFYYDTNPLDGSFSQYSNGRLTAVQNATIAPGGQVYPQFNEMYSYTQAGQVSKKRLQVSETLASHSGSLNMDASYTYDNEGQMTSVNYPKTYYWNGSALVPTSGPTYTYSFDSMHRPTGLTDQSSYAAVSNVQYGPSNELTSINYFGASETRTYNSMLQMTRLTVVGQQDILYNYPTANNGKIAGQTDNVSGETVTYLYDSLNRLKSASAGGWNQSFTYDGFGNMLTKTGVNSPALSIAVNAATNQIVGQTYDANGNQLTGIGISGYAGYDAENRLVSAPGVAYGYDSQNKRVWRGTFDGSGNLTAQEVYFFGIDGKKLGTYTLTMSGSVMSNTNTDMAVYFGGKRVAKLQTGGSLISYIQDRLGSQGKYYPYGEDRNSPTMPNDQVKFATYTRDSATLLDYADQRYYANNFGRFMTADQYTASGGVGDPSSWNRYTYTRNDPVNRMDPGGLEDEGPPPLPPFTFCPDGTTIFFGGSQCPSNNAWGWNIGPTISIDFSALLRLFLPKKVTATDDQAKKIDQAYADALSRLIVDPKCHDALSTAGADATATLENTSYDATNVLGPGVGGKPDKTDPANIIIDLNSAGVFFTAVPAANGKETLIIGATTPGGQGTAVTFLSQTSANAFILLHELGHETGIFGNDGGPGLSPINAQYSWDVLVNCFGIPQPGGH